MKNTKAILLCLLAFACGAPEDEATEFGTAEQAYQTYGTSIRYFGTVQDANNTATSTSQSATTPVRFLQVGGQDHPSYGITVAAGFTGTQRTNILQAYNDVIGGYTENGHTHLGINAELDAADVTSPPNFFVDSTSGHVGAIHIAQGGFSNTNPPTSALTASYANVAWYNCSADLPEQTALPGKFQACANANVLFDYADLAAYPTDNLNTGSFWPRMHQLATHILLAATGASGSYNSTSTYTSRNFSITTQNNPINFRPGQACMLVNFFDSPADVPGGAGIYGSPFMGGCSE